jgi:hypothetical protein
MSFPLAVLGSLTRAWAQGDNRTGVTAETKEWGDDDERILLDLDCLPSVRRGRESSWL